MPVGFKNATDGDVQVAAEACLAAAGAHTYLGITRGRHDRDRQQPGQPGLPRRPARRPERPELHRHAVASALETFQASGLPRRVMIDASHGNSGKNHRRQEAVAIAVAGQVAAGERGIAGVMLESNLVAGRQEPGPRPSLVYGQSVTDPCMGWSATVSVLETLAAAVRTRRTLAGVLPVNDVDAIIGWLLEAPRGRLPGRGLRGHRAALRHLRHRGHCRHALARLRGADQRRAAATAGTRRGGRVRAARNALRGQCARRGGYRRPAPPRVPDTALQALGTDADGTALGDDGVPLGRALAGLGVRREPLEVLATPGQLDAAGREQVVWSAARLWLDAPVALVTECFYKEFLDAYPGPWALPCPGPRTAP